MSFHNVRMPEDVERGAQGGPGFKTTIIRLDSGFEKRNIDWERSKGRWDLSYGVETRADQQDVMTFFYARRGRAYGFRFKDWMDYEVGDDATDTFQQIGTGDTTTTKFQISKLYTSGGETFTRQLTRIVAGTTRVFLSGAEQMSGWTVDNDTGVITFSVAPSAVPVQVICEFDVPVRFDVDELPQRWITMDAAEIPDLPIVEIPEALASLV